MANLVEWIIPHGILEMYRNYHDSKVEHDIKVINFQVNNFCNSRCVMCDIWRKNDQENINPDQFAKILKDPLFKNVEHIGITGGEPTLTKNLAQYFQVAIEVLPQIQGLSMITNSLIPNQIKKITKEISTICNNHGKQFSVMISLDGLYEMHDLVRGREGNFNKVLEMINWLKEENIPFMTGTTITKYNVWNMDKLLIFLKQNGIYGRFRIGEFINRLYNNTPEHEKVIRNFDRDEIYQLLLFFTKLEYTFESSENVKNTYRSIRHMLQGGQRLIGCPYKNRNAVNLDCHGGLSYCAPKSNVIGNLLEDTGNHLYAKHINELDQIEKNHCMNCIHDYHSEPTDELSNMLNEESKYMDIINISAYNQMKHEISKRYFAPRSNKYRLFIVGWYGTETVGDKAILGGIVDSYLQRHGSDNLEVFISSLYPFVTQRTIDEMQLNATVVPVYSEKFFKHASIADEVVVGGGPLMELEQLSLIEWAFKMAKDNGKKTTVFGSGIGPLYSEEKKAAVCEILTLSDHIYLRDDSSVAWASRMTSRQDIINIGDPAIQYIEKIRERINPEKKNNKLSCYLRELTYDYFGNMPYEKFLEFKENFEYGLAKNIIFLCQNTGLVPHFYAMHNFVIGNDDRDFNYKFVNKYFSNMDVFNQESLSTIESIVESMKSSRLNLCMRFHSVLFANTLNTDYIAIDYTAGGKINSFLTEKNKTDKMKLMEDIIKDETELYRSFQGQEVDY